jgi:DNA-binding transcriptional ArsR family regulator
MPTDRSSRKGKPRSSKAGSRDAPTLHLRDPKDIRALAHPARIAIIDALASGDELTATECAGLTGLSPSATAYHLKFLERYGFAEPAAGRGDGRERPWRARRRRVDLDASTPARAAAAAAVGLAYFERSRAMAVEFMEHAHEEAEEWRDVVFMSNADMWLTVEEARNVAAALEAVLEPYRGRAPADRPDGSRRVRIMSMGVPHRKR